MDKHPLQAYREAQTPPLSRAALADSLGVNRVTVHRWETFERKIEPDFLPTISEKTGIPARDLRPDLFELLGEAAQ